LFKGFKEPYFVIFALVQGRIFMEIIRKSNKRVAKTMSKINLDLCRYWQTERGRGWLRALLAFFTHGGR
jgi:hypothetical protein